MTRVYVLGDRVTLFVPDAWTIWTHDGARFERRNGVILQCFLGKWRVSPCSLVEAA
jgi:hypothetical protein